MSEQEQLNSADFQAGQQVEEAQPAAPAIAPELIASVGSLRAIATAHNLLDTGMFPHSKAEAERTPVRHQQETLPGWRNGFRKDRIKNKSK